MSLLLRQPWNLCSRKPVFVRSSSSPPPCSNGLTLPCVYLNVDPCGEDVGRLIIHNHTERYSTLLEKKVPMELFDPTVTIGASHGWVATLKEDGIVRLHDDLNPNASYANPKRISLPPLVTLPHCQTQVVTNVAMSSSSPEDDQDCVVAIKFLGPQLSLCRPAARTREWVNIRIENPCFFSSPVMYSKKHDMFRIPASGGHLIGSWDLHKRSKFESLRLHNTPGVWHKSQLDLLDSCATSEHLVESRITDETFLVRRYTRMARIIKGMPKMKTENLLVFKLDDEGNARYIPTIQDLDIFLSKSEPFCFPSSSSSSSHGISHVHVLDVDESAHVSLGVYTSVSSRISRDGFRAPYHIPPQEKITY